MIIKKDKYNLYISLFLKKYYNDILTLKERLLKEKNYKNFDIFFSSYILHGINKKTKYNFYNGLLKKYNNIKDINILNLIIKELKKQGII